MTYIEKAVEYRVGSREKEFKRIPSYSQPPEIKKYRFKGITHTTIFPTGVLGEGIGEKGFLLFCYIVFLNFYNESCKLNQLFLIYFFIRFRFVIVVNRL